ncbi:ABC transporter substrate-binding protein [Cohnella terricola]|nr:extracellular solute-binding protein [Cohnella terricola]
MKIVSKRRKGIVSKALILFLVSAFILTACGKSDDSNTPSASGGSGGGDKITISIAHTNVTDDPGAKLFRETLQKFKDAHPNVEIREEAVAHDLYRSKMTTLGASGELPDVFLANGSMLIDYAPKGLVAEWDDLLEQDKEWKDGFLQDAFEDFRIKGKIYGVATQTLSVHLIFYNEEIFKQVGIHAFPETWKDFEDAIVKLKDAGYIPIAMGNKANVPVGSTLFSTLADRVTGTQWFNGLTTGESKFTDPEFIEALKKIQELKNIGAFNPDINSIDEGQRDPLYFNKKAAMTVSGAWYVGNLIQNAPEDVLNNTKIAILPSTGGKGEAAAVAGGGGWSYAINAKLTDAKKATAVELVKTFTNDEYAAAMKKINGFPARKLTDDGSTATAPLTQEYYNLMNRVQLTPIYDIRLAPATVEVIYRGIQSLLAGAASPEDIAKQAQDSLGK